MPCDQPIKGFRSVEKHERTGKHLITFNPLKAINSHLPISFPCGRCLGCRLDKSDQWATRCTHEAQMHEFNSFITLTYAKEHLPADYSVNLRTWQLFMKRLRKDLDSTKVRFFACGEYGDLNLRPHYHALIFGYAFPDREFYSTTTGGYPQFTSAQLSRAWPFGRATLGNVTYSSAKYCAGYVMKKVTGAPANSYYERVHPDTGQPVQVEPEFATMSGKPGIGHNWFQRYRSDCFPSDFVIIEGSKKPVPQYYLGKLTEEDRQNVTRRRKLRAAAPKKKADRTKERLAVRAFIKAERVKRGQRNLKDDDQ